jgi:hypothetical protein
MPIGFPGMVVHPVIQATQEAEIGKFVVQGQPRQKVSKTLSQQNKLGMMVHTYNPAMWEV